MSLPYQCAELHRAEKQLNQYKLNVKNAFTLSILGIITLLSVSAVLTLQEIKAKSDIELTRLLDDGDKVHVVLV